MNILAALVNNGSAEDFPDAVLIVNEMNLRIVSGEDPQEVLEEYGLEPDYLFEL